MPFELGLAVAWQMQRPLSHMWFAFERKPFRLNKSLSDLNGSDHFVHDGSISGVWRELLNAFSRADRQPTVDEMRGVYRTLLSAKPSVLRASGSDSVFKPRPFRELIVAARRAAER